MTDRNPSSPENSPLGKASRYLDHYAPALLFPIARDGKRQEIGVQSQALPFMGADLWTAYELSWLNTRGKPQVALAHITIPCESPCIIESKSFKLYLNSLNNSVFADAAAVQDTLRRDLSAAVSTPTQAFSVGVQLIDPDRFDQQQIHELDGLNLDRLDIECSHYTPAPELLNAATHEAPVSETLCSRLLKSNCLVTGQPDWGSVQIRYRGPQIDQAGLLAYLVSFRNHNEFHEQCVERIFTDIWRRCQPIKLSVYARYTRRGGLDINPFRTSFPQGLPPNIRMARQ